MSGRDDAQLGPPTMGDHDDEARRAAAYNRDPSYPRLSAAQGSARRREVARLGQPLAEHVRADGSLDLRFASGWRRVLRSGAVTREQAHNPRECWCGLDHARRARTAPRDESEAPDAA